MRVIHVVPTISNEASGPSYSVPRLCEALIAEGADVQLAALAQPSTRIELPFVKTFPLGLGPARLGASPNCVGGSTARQHRVASRSCTTTACG
jgi:hypothetical protein